MRATEGVLNRRLSCVDRRETSGTDVERGKLVVIYVDSVGGCALALGLVLLGLLYNQHYVT
jgi:hypothetical protein